MIINIQFSSICIALSAVLVASCASTSIVDARGISQEVVSETYATNQSSKGIVLLDVNWGRYWNCGGYENAQLINMAFDRVPVRQKSDDVAPDLFIEGPSRLTVKQTFLSYALLLDPGEYAMSGMKIKGARSVSDVGNWTVPRSKLIKDGKSLAGSFSVAAGETVYIGNFGLDCFQYPGPWRYYTKGRANFQAHVQQYIAKYPFLDDKNITFRLFDTHDFGKPYELD